MSTPEQTRIIEEAVRALADAEAAYQTALQNIEGDLGNARRYYNATVRDYNTSIQLNIKMHIINFGFPFITDKVKIQF